MLCVSIPLSAYDFEVDGFYYNVISEEEKQVEVTYKDYSYNSYSGVINIPSLVAYNGNNYSVKRIGKNAFRDCTNVIAVKIPNTVISIENSAFFECTNINSLTIGSGVTKIKDEAFSENGPYSTKSNPYTISKVIWAGNTPPDGTLNIIAENNYVSNDEFNLQNRTVYPFLSSRFEVNNVVYVPVSPSDRTCDVIDCNYNPSNSEIVIDSVVNNRDVELKVLNVNSYAFYRNPKITKLTISNNGSIGGWAFADCDALTSVVASNNGNIGVYSFNECDALASVDANNNGNIGHYSFFRCGALTSVEACNNGSIESFAFAHCQKLSSVSLGDKITALESNAFRADSSLDNIIIPDNVTKLANEVFEECTSLKSVSIGKGIDILGWSSFRDCSSLSSIVIPKNIRIIQSGVFTGCSNLGDITIEEFESSREPQYFPDWTSTNHNDNSESSHEYSINVQPDDVLSFKIWSDCESKDVLKVRIEYIDNDHIDSWEIYTLSGDGKTYTFTKTFTKSQVVSLKVEYSKDNSVSSGKDEAGIRNISIYDIRSQIVFDGYSRAFSDCKLDEVYIGKKLVYDSSSDKGYSPFYRNASLRKVTITDAETEIYENEFYGCSNLQEFSCGDGVTSIGSRAFSGCSALTSYVSGTSVKTIGDEAFSDCTALTSFTSEAAVPPVCGTQALDDINKWECKLYVPAESQDEYKAAPQWKEFFFIENSSVGDIISDNQGELTDPIEIYNLSGIKVSGSTENLTPGIYIKKQGSITEKIMVK